MTKEMNIKIAVGLLVILVLAVGSFAYVASTLFASAGPPDSMQTVFGAGNYVFQGLFVTNTDGSTYWANADKPFNLAALLGSDGDNFAEVQTVQNNIYMNIKEQDVTAWSFSCFETITVKDSSGAVIDTVASQTVTAQGQSAEANQNIWVTGASFSANDFMSILNQPAGTYTFMVTLSNINLQLTVNGQTQSLSAPSGSSENVLSWTIQIT